VFKRLFSTFLKRLWRILLVIILSVVLAIPDSAYVGTKLTTPTYTSVAQTAQKPSSPLNQLPQSGITDPQELEVFLDNFFTRSMQAEHIPGAAFVLVKDGKIFLAKGYGYADLEKQIPVLPEKTVFRVGSVSKLLTATAVMQLVEQGQLNLNDDVNHYLQNFKLKTPYSQPVTVANLLTHTSGIDENFIGIAARSLSDITPLNDYLAQHLPPCTLPPGQIIRYSNQGFALAGYLVEIISKLPYAYYIDENILEPLGMRHSSFLFKPSILANLAVGYGYKNDGYQQLPILYTNDTPSGGLNATATDMAKFAIAHLQNGRYGNSRILQDATAQQMHRQQFTHHPQLPGQAFGFYERFQNGLRLLEHDGHISGFKSRFVLIPEQNIGFFSAYNNDKNQLHDQLLNEFLNHYYPQSENILSLNTAQFREAYRDKGIGIWAAEAEEVSAYWSNSATPLDTPGFTKKSTRDFTGNYRYIRYPHQSIEKLGLLLPDSPLKTFDLKITANANGGLSLGTRQLVAVDSLLFEPIDRSPIRFRLIPFRQVAFRENKRGKITYLFLGKYAFEKIPWYKTTIVQLSLLGLCLTVFLAGILIGIWENLRNPRRQQLLGWLLADKRQSQQPVHLALVLPSLVCTLNLGFVIGLLLALTLIDLTEFAYGMPFIVEVLLGIPVITTTLSLVLPVLAILSLKCKEWSTFRRRYYTLITFTAWVFIVFLNNWNILEIKL
jgi:CubicO group peptidase (beta-lactamase class C family)